MATGNITLDTGSTLKTATYTISEDASTKHIPRSTLNTNDGSELGINTNPLVVATSGGTLTSLGSITGIVNITGSTVVVGSVLITGSTTIANAVLTVTGSTVPLVIAGTASTNVLTVQGNTAGIPLNVTGSTVVVGSVLITGSTSVINTVAITGSTEVLNIVTITGSTVNLTGDANIGRVKITDGTNVNTIFSLSSANTLAVALVDTNGTQISSFGGGTQYTEDAAAATNPVGTVPILIRKDTPAGEVTTDGDNVAQRGTNYGAAYVTLIDSSGTEVSVGGGTQYTEDAAATANPIGNALNLIRDDSRGGSLTTTNGDNVAARGTNSGELYVKHVDVITVTGSTTIIGTVTVTGSTVIVGTVTVTGSTTIANAVLTVTGSTVPLVIAGTASTNVLTVQGNSAGIPVNVTGSTVVVGTVSVTGSTTIANALLTVTGSTSVVNIVTVTGSTTIAAIAKTMLSTAGTLAATYSTIVPSVSSQRIKVYAFSVTTTSSTQQLINFQTGTTAVNGTNLWSLSLLAVPSGSTGANLAVTPPAFLFATSATQVLNLNASSTNAVHYSLSYFTEA